jgi:gamma-glutamyltranspeptidase/glutathione hydrolase
MASREPAFLARPNLEGSFGACASTHWVASTVAQSVLERGGNAFDAAVAGAFVLHLVEPHLNGPGGDLVALIRPADGSPTVLCGQGPAPRGATIAHFRDEGLAAVPGAGALAAAIPGAVDAWLLLLSDHGSWSLEDVLAYAIHYAEVGQPLGARAAAMIAEVAELFRADWPSSAACWLSDGRAPEPGTLVTNPAWAATLRRLCEEAREQAGAGASRAAVIDAGRAIWRGGFVAEAIDRFVADTPHVHSTGTVHHGVLDAEDMRGFCAHYEAPISLSFRGHEIYKAGPWCQGPALLQCLAILAEESEENLDVDTADGIHRVVETLKLALADRDAYYGDGLAPAALEILLSDAYAQTRRAEITEQASAEIRPGHGAGLPQAYSPPLSVAGAGESSAAGEPTVGDPTVGAAGRTRGDTCHIDVVDRWGNAISATPSGGWLQSSPTVPELGFCLGTRLQMTFLDPASPAALAPGRRPRTTLTPTIVAGPGQRLTVLGTPGGDFQDQWQLVYLLRTLVLGMSPQAAIEAPTFHTTSFPNSFWPRTWEPAGLVIEDRVGPEVIAALKARGHAVTVTGGWELGRLSSVTRDGATGIISAAANPRGGQGYAVGR